MYLFRRGLTAALFTLSLSSLTAQDADIVVTATKEPTPAETLPVGVVVLDPEDLKGKTTVSDALESTLAVRLSSQVPGLFSLTAPGFGENGFGRILLLLDGFSQNSPDMSPFQPLDLIPVFALDRIEILRGPASSVYGTGAVAGAVNLVTRTPEKFEAEISTALTSNLTNRQALTAGIPVSDGGLLISLQRSQNLPSRDRSDSDGLQAWSKFSYPVVQGDLEQKWELWGAFSKGNTQLPGELTPAQYRTVPDFAKNQDDSSENSETKGGATYSVSGGGWSLELPASATSRLVRFHNASWGPGGSYSGSQLLLAGFEPRLKVSLGPIAGAEVDWTTGAAVQGARLVSDLYSDSSFGSVTQEALVQRWAGSWTNRVEAVWNRQWFAEASVRGEFSRTTASSEQNAAVAGQKDFLPLSGDVGATWLPSKGVQVGVQLARLFRYPFVDEMVGYQGYSSFFYSDLEAEVGHALNLVASYSEGPVRVSLSGTATRMENEVMYDTSDPDWTKQRNRNLGPTQHLTALLSAEVLPASWATAGAEYSYESAQLVTGLYDGKSVPLVPAHRGRVWTKAVWETYGWADLSWTVSSPFYPGGDFTNSSEMIAGRQSVDAQVTVLLGSPDVLVVLSGKNLTDDRTPVFAYSNSYYPVEGRTFGATLSWKL